MMSFVLVVYFGLIGAVYQYYFEMDNEPNCVNTYPPPFTQPPPVSYIN